MTVQHTPKPLLWMALLATVALDGLVQFIWKAIAITLPDALTIQTALAVLVPNPLTWILAGIFAIKLFLWLWVLARADLSLAKPMTSLSYVGVAIASLLVGETWHWQNAVSVLLILIGVYLVSASDEGQPS